MISRGLPDWMTVSSSRWFRHHLVGIGDEVGGEVAAVELHALDDLGLGLQALVLLDGDHALIADLLHRVGDLLADLGLAIGGDGADLGDLGAVGDRAGGALDALDHGGDGLVDAALQVHRVHARGDGLHALAHDGLGQDGGGGGAVAGLVIGARRNLADHLRAHVLELVLKLDLFGDGDAVLGDARRAEGLVEDHVAAFRAQGHLDGVGEDVDALEHFLAGFGVELDVLGHVFSS